MTDPAMIAARHARTLTELAGILAKHDPEVGERIRRANHGRGVPSPSKQPLETAAFQAECMLSLARLIDERLAPKKRGRPRKNAG
jgi:hypothetical protein